MKTLICGMNTEITKLITFTKYFVKHSFRRDGGKNKSKHYGTHAKKLLRDLRLQVVTFPCDH